MPARPHSAQPTQHTDRRLYQWRTSSPRSSVTSRTRSINKAVKSELKTLIRKFREAADAGNKDAAIDACRAAARKLDKAVSKGVIHKNQAANRKSSIMKQAASL